MCCHLQVSIRSLVDEFDSLGAVSHRFIYFLLIIISIIILIIADVDLSDLVFTKFN